LPDHRVAGVEDRLGRAVVLFEGDDPRAGDSFEFPAFAGIPPASSGESLQFGNPAARFA
jgi:hypothetical protein